MKTTTDLKQFEEITNIKVDIASVKTEIKHINKELRSLGSSIEKMFLSLEKKICENQKELSSSANTRSGLCNERFKALENDTRKIWEKLSTIGIFIYILVREVAPRLIDIVSP